MVRSPSEVGLDTSELNGQIRGFTNSMTGHSVKESGPRSIAELVGMYES